MTDLLADVVLYLGREFPEEYPDWTEEYKGKLWLSSTIVLTREQVENDIVPLMRQWLLTGKYVRSCNTWAESAVARGEGRSTEPIIHLQDILNFTGGVKQFEALVCWVFYATDEDHIFFA